MAHGRPAPPGHRALDPACRDDVAERHPRRVSTSALKGRVAKGESSRAATGTDQAAGRPSARSGRQGCRVQVALGDSRRGCHLGDRVLQAVTRARAGQHLGDEVRGRQLAPPSPPRRPPRRSRRAPGPRRPGGPSSAERGPRRTSSYVLVTRGTPPRGGSPPNAFFERVQGRGQPVRRLEEDDRAAFVAQRVSAPRAPPACAAGTPRSSTGRVGSPDSASAVSTAHGPGADVTGSRPRPPPRPAGSPGRTRRACRRPSRRRPSPRPPRASSSAVRSTSLCSWNEHPAADLDPQPRASASSRRVSSAATTSASASGRRGAPRRPRCCRSAWQPARDGLAECAVGLTVVTPVSLPPLGPPPAAQSPPLR